MSAPARICLRDGGCVSDCTLPGICYGATEPAPTARVNVPGTVYLIHLDRPYMHARHYLGWTETPATRFDRHRAGGGSKLLAAARAAGIGWSVVRTWDNVTRAFERRLHDQRNDGPFCPVCNPARWWQRGIPKLGE